MLISTKYVIEFSTEHTNEIIAICNSISTVQEYLSKKFQFNDTVDVSNNEGYYILINMDYGKIKVRKIDFVED